MPAPQSSREGLAAFTRQVEDPVRARALRYAAEGAVAVVASTGASLWGKIRGGSLYSSRFERAGANVRFACSCQYFADRHAVCKHLHALAIAQMKSPFVSGVTKAARFVPDPALLQQASPTDDEANSDEDEDVIYVDDDESDDDFEFYDVEDPPFVEREPPPRRASGSGDWRHLLMHAAFREGRGDKQIELVYFIEAGEGPQGCSIVIAERAVGGASAVLLPFAPWRGVQLVHAVDRELHGLFEGERSVHGWYGSRDQAHRGRISQRFASVMLERLAHSGRCHIVPSAIPNELKPQWSLLTSGSRTSQADRQRRNTDFSDILAWPKLADCLNEEVGLELAIVAAASSSKKSGKRSFDVEPILLRGGQPQSARTVIYVHRDGLAICGSDLVRMRPQSALWLEAIRQQGTLRVSEKELPELIEAASELSGFSDLRLPSGYERITDESPKWHLDLAIPLSNKVEGRVQLEYAGQRVDADRRAALLVKGQRVLVRQRERELAALEQLRSLGFRGVLLGNGRSPHVSLESKRVPQAVRALLAAGWSVQAAGKRYRAASSVEIEVESGIDWFEVRGKARFEGGELPFPRLLAALKQRSHAVQLGDGSWGLLPEEWLARFGLFAELPAAKGDALRFSTRQIGLVDALCATLPEEGAGARGLAELRERLAQFRDVKAVRAPRGFAGQLRSYQAEGLGWLLAVGKLGFGACLADDMGLGKTIQVLAYLLTLKPKSANKPALVVVPRSLLGNWLDEAARFAPELSIRQHWGAERLRSKDAFRDVDVVLTTYGTLRLDIALLGEVEFSSVVLDEAQAIKNKQSATAKCAKLLRADRRVAMSGTPVENHLGELWSLFEFLNPGLLDELSGLQTALESPKPSAEVLALVRTLVRPFVLRRTKREVASELPVRSEQTLLIDLEPEERVLYDELHAHYRQSLSKRLSSKGEAGATPHLLEALLRLRQAACHPGLLDESARERQSAKVELLVERLRALAEEGHRALVFSQFTSLLAIVRARLDRENVTYEYLDGKTRDRAARVAHFQADPTIQAFLISLKAGGVGLNLTGADYVFILDPWWNPAAEAQAIDRAHRIGQTRHVIAYRLLARNTVEERVAHLQNQKRDLVAGIMGDDAALSTKLTREDFEALLSLTA